MAQSFQEALRELINRHSMENGSDTPDYMLAEYLCDCLATYETIIVKRERWYGRKVGQLAAVGVKDLMPAPSPPTPDNQSKG